ncbi:PIG-L deacetylase family protein [Allostreptomyces psammosilenae]|uniref:LmbE family N-acetylglucosaminyl deacetylase n=1 Tax=Allostreptomyces psammosilenae TaxID=1892865 RepID=A0A853A306_9ACTN|nr:PIG-L family deacetylase [Allostreptomyces psammosilenae]NYI05111.1 LmbE family N-acetylglucosaminyl deacetylase [Allostreptomyces psammosilenae]
MTGPTSSPIDTPGTPEELWRRWSGWEHFPALDLTGVRSAVVIAPHPDDEVLALGGTLARLARTGARVRLVAVTDGETSHPRSATLTPGRVADVRIAETSEALQRLGLGDAEVVRLGIPDTRIARHESALVARLTRLVEGFDLCLAPWRGDAHADHEAAGRAARRACRERAVRLATYPVAMWHWAAPDDPRVPWDTAAAVPLDDRERAAKTAAVACFTSQLWPAGPGPEETAILPPQEVAHFDREVEVVFR